MNKPCNFCEHRHFKEEEPSDEVYKMSVEKYIEWEKSIPCRNCKYNDWNENYKESLKRCPFCGGEVEVNEHKQRSLPSVYNVICRECSIGTKMCESKEEAITAWNRRV